MACDDYDEDGPEFKPDRILGRLVITLVLLPPILLLLAVWLFFHFH